MITFTEQWAMMRLLHLKSTVDGDIVITRKELEEEISKLRNHVEDASGSLCDINDAIIDALDVLWKESFNHEQIKFAYEVLMPVVMLHYNKSDLAKLENFDDLKLALEMYMSVVGNTGHSIDHETARELYDRSNTLLAKMKSGSC